MERIPAEAPELFSGLQALKDKMLPVEFEQYINSLITIKQGNGMLLVITKKEMYRSIIESKFLPAIQASFGIENVRIISQT